MHYKRIRKVLVTTLLAAMLMVTGCSSGKSSSSNDTTTTQEQTSQDTTTNENKGEMPTMGKITKISGKKITIALVSNEGMQKPSGDKAPDQSGTDKSSSDKSNTDSSSTNNDNKTNSDSQTKSDQTSGDTDKQSAPEMQLSGETKTITVTDDTKITIDQESKSLSDLKVDDLIQVTMSGDTVTAIQSGMGGGGPMNGEKKTDSSDSSKESTNSN
ncbi:hypothetical protein lbkm_1915 [Lachnospiraceae bacterium KM106-2]|nr:hypothetical protein lbkm_1915 [Lachnospiraceae bacterium KM106-2]